MVACCTPHSARTSFLVGVALGCVYRNTLRFIDSPPPPPQQSPTFTNHGTRLDCSLLCVMQLVLVLSVTAMTTLLTLLELDANVRILLCLFDSMQSSACVAVHTPFFSHIILSIQLPVTVGSCYILNFLLKLGFETRLENLSKNIVDVNEKQIFIANNKKVVDEKSMGDLFKVMEVF
jgi:hypothetical protein